jgi:hypothetical protein
MTAQLADARTRMTGNFRALRYDLAILPRVKSNITRNPLAWFSAAAILGLLLSRIAPSRRAHPPRVAIKLPSRQGDATEKAGKAAFGFTILKLVLDFAKPAILRYIASRFHPTAPRR